MNELEWPGVEEAGTSSKWPLNRRHCATSLAVQKNTSLKSEWACKLWNCFQLLKIKL